MFCPYLISINQSMLLKHLLYMDCDLGCQKNNNLEVVTIQLQRVPSSTKRFLMSSAPLEDRCLRIARLFGDESEVRFWLLASYYLKYYSKVDDFENQHTILDTSFDHLMLKEDFKEFQLQKLKIRQGMKNKSQELVQYCSNKYILLNEPNAASELLLDTECDHDLFYSNALLTCLLNSKLTDENIAKLVATNLIASDHLTEGVQLLTMYDKVTDACKYLQSYGEWNKAVWLAKCRLSPDEEFQEITRRWVDFLANPPINLKSNAIHVLLAAGQFSSVISHMVTAHQHERAALFIKCLRSHNFEVDYSKYEKDIDDVIKRVQSSLGIQSLSESKS